MAGIVPVHNRVKGRGRYYIPGLKGSEEFITAFKTRMMADQRVTRITSSLLTGRVLVFYDPLVAAPEMAELVQTAADHVQSLDPGAKKESVQENAPETEQPKPSKAKQAIEKLQRFIKTREDGPETNWFARPAKDALDHFNSDSRKGISGQSVESRRREYGENILPRTVSRSGMQIFCEQMNSLPVYLLGAAAGVSVITGGMLDAAVIFGVVVANGIIGYVTETKAEKNIDALNDLVQHMAEVVRDGKPVFVAAEEVVPGDILLLKPGSYVPADSRIIQASQLTIDESMLTGESLPVKKHAKPLKNSEIGLADRKNMAFMGTCITGGQGLAVVVATGSGTEIGKLKLLLNDTLIPQTPIERQLDTIGNQLILMCGAVCAGVFGLGIFMGFGALNMLRMSISLAAAAVPEGLPAMATINFALGINRMKKDNIIVRHLPAVETLGAIQTICLDKTGTITRNRMKAVSIHAGGRWIHVEKDFLVTEENGSNSLENLEINRLLSVCALCCETKINGRCSDGRLDISGSATESALTQLVNEAGIDVKKMRKASPLIRVNHRSEKRLYMSTIHRTEEKGQLLVMVKGSPLEVLSRCDFHIRDSKRQSLTREIRKQIEQANESMAKDALRVLGFAYCHMETQDLEEKDREPEVHMTWLGLVGMMDPPREGIKELIAQFHRAGVRTVMITGDQQISACAIANRLNLSQGTPLEIMDAQDLGCLEEEQLIERARTVHVYSRVTPSQKLKIVKAIQASGQTVAMTGDGINDSPALKASDIGIAMGETGTDLARDVADVVLTQDNLELMAAALADGRSIYQNIRKSVHFSLATNISEIQLITTAIAMGMNSPLNVMQLLWINLISDIFPGLALSAERPETDVMDQTPRNPEEPLFSKKDFRTMMIESTAITGGAMGSLLYGMAKYGAGARAGGLAFQSLTIGQLLHALTCRSETTGLFTKKDLPRNRYLDWAIGGSIAIQLATMFFGPLRSFLGLSAITLSDGLIIGATSTLPLVLNETTKAVKEKQSEPPGTQAVHGKEDEKEPAADQAQEDKKGSLGTLHQAIQTKFKSLYN